MNIILFSSDMEPSVAFAILNAKTVAAGSQSPLETPPPNRLLPTPPAPTSKSADANNNVAAGTDKQQPALLDNRITGANFFFASQLFRHELVRREHGVLNDTNDAKIVVQSRPEIPFLLPQDQRFTQRPQPQPQTPPRPTPGGLSSTGQEETRSSFINTTATTQPLPTKEDTRTTGRDVTAPVFLVDSEDDDNQELPRGSTSIASAARTTTKTPPVRSTFPSSVKDYRPSPSQLNRARQRVEVTKYRAEETTTYSSRINEIEDRNTRPNFRGKNWIIYIDNVVNNKRSLTRG